MPFKRNKKYPEKELAALAGLTKRDAIFAFDTYRDQAFEKPDQPGKKYLRFVLNKSGVVPPFIHAIPIRDTSASEASTMVELAHDQSLNGHEPLSVRVDINGSASSKSFHIAFAKDNGAIVTGLEKGGQLMPSDNPARDLHIAQSALDATIIHSTRH